MYLGVGALVLLGCGAAGYFLFSQTPESLESGVRAATATALKADVFLMSPGTEETPIEQTAVIHFGNTLRTSETGRALIDTDGGGSVMLDYASNFTLLGDETHTTAQLATGQAWARVEKLFGQGEFFEIETGNAVAMVRGTAFGVSYRENATVVLVTEGTVAVVPRDPETGMRDMKRTVLVREGQKAVVDNGTVTVGPLTDADRRQEWFEENNPQTTGSTVEKPVRVLTPGENPAPIATNTPAVRDEPTPTPKATDTPASPEEETSTPNATSAPGVSDDVTPASSTPNRDVQSAP